ncbi:MAG: cell division protein SepF [Clostridia bacterium]|nr:cell division protein SepF [Clostridia bacterium]
MAFWDDAKKKVLQVMRPKQQSESQGYSPNRADGGFSGYVPKMNRQQMEPNPTGYQQPRPAGFENMMPTGVDPSVMQGFQPVGGQTGQVQPQQAPFGQTGYQQPFGGQQMPPRPQAQFQGQQAQNGPAQPGSTFRHNVPQPTRPGFGQPAFAQNAQQPQQGFTSRQSVPVQQPVQQPQNHAPAEPNGQTFAFPGGDSYVVDGNAYKLIFRVAQITGVPSCFRVIEFMYNNEAVIVNAEQITDLVEADRCMDLIFGAACAMKQRLMRVSGKQIYLITPPQVYVAPFEGLRRAGMADIERRWPGAMQANMQPQQMPGAQPFAGNVQQMAPQQMRQDDFAGGFGRRAARSQMNTNGYTDYGGFSAKGR